MRVELRPAVVFGTLLLGAGAVVTWAWLSRRNPSACPYGQRVLLDLPRPFLRRDELLRMLAPVAGERLLEVGPGTGYYTLDVARRLEPGGQLDALDLQSAMLEETMRRAAARGVRDLREQAEAVGLRYERHRGRFGYLARFGVSKETV